jgi:hypothetical protein
LLVAVEAVVQVELAVAVVAVLVVIEPPQELLEGAVQQNQNLELHLALHTS